MHQVTWFINMGLCASCFTLARKICKTSDVGKEQETKSIVDRKEHIKEMNLKKINNAPKLELESNELYAARRKMSDPERKQVENN
jgi:hypothetical protein